MCAFSSMCSYVIHTVLICLPPPTEKIHAPRPQRKVMGEGVLSQSRRSLSETITVNPTHSSDEVSWYSA